MLEGRLWSRISQDSHSLTGPQGRGRGVAAWTLSLVGRTFPRGQGATPLWSVIEGVSGSMERGVLDGYGDERVVVEPGILRALGIKRRRKAGEISGGVAEFVRRGKNDDGIFVLDDFLVDGEAGRV